MPGRDPLIDPRDPLRALTLLTRLPVPGADGARDAASAWTWPLVGLVIGGLASLGGWIALMLGLPPAAAAGTALVVGIITTGGLHEDGLADCADGFWGGHTPERRLEIMRDSRIGSYGVLALILGVGLKWVLLTALLDMGALWLAILVPAVLSRGAMAGVMAALPFAREDGLARHVGRPSVTAAASGCLLATIGAVALAGLVGLLAAVFVAGMSLAVARLSVAKIGGQTGDVLGAVQHLSEITAMAVLVALLP
ncbi:MAG: adenosylcobinamide-GDP ribazoletransferase [Pseudomonadota bacterium]